MSWSYNPPLSYGNNESLDLSTHFPHCFHCGEEGHAQLASRYPRRVSLSTASSQFVHHEIGQQKMPQVIYSKPLWLMWKATWLGLAETEQSEQSERESSSGALVEMVKGLETLGSEICWGPSITRLILQRTPVWQLDLYLYAILASRLFGLFIRSSRQSQVLRSVGPESVDIVPWAHSPRVHRYLTMWFSSSRGKLAPILNYRTTCQWHKPQPVQLLKLYLIMFPAHKSCSTHRSRSGAPHTFRASNVKHLLYNIF